MKLHELLERRAQCVAEMRSIADKADTERRDLSADEDSKFNTLKTELSDLDRKIERARTLAEAERSAPGIVHRDNIGDDYESRARDFSICRAITASLPRDCGGDPSVGGLEREISSEVQRRSGRTFQGIAVPDECFRVERRTLLAGSSAADLVPNVHASAQFIDVLRARLVTGRLGATVLDGLVGTVDLPRQTGSSAAQWVAEDGSLSETDASFDDVNLSPKTVGAMTSYSRRTLINAVPSVENIVRNDLASVIASAIDIKAVLGNGTSNTPTGIINAGATEMNVGSTLTWDEILQFVAQVDADDALENSLAWLTSPWIVAKLRATTKVTSDAGAGFVMEDARSMAGYPVASTSAMPGNAPPDSPSNAALVFGDWSQLLIGYWSGTDILINPYETTAYAKGRVLIRAMRDCDVAVRHPEAFAFADSLST